MNKAGKPTKLFVEAEKTMIKMGDWGEEETQRRCVYVFRCYDEQISSFSIGSVSGKQS